MSKFDYDEQNDLLYIWKKDDPADAYGNEEDDAEGIVVFREVETEEHIGYIIFDPVREAEKRIATLKEKGYWDDVKFWFERNT